MQQSKVVNGSANLRGYLMTARVQPYALIGLGAMWRQDDVRAISDTAIMLRMGGGIELWLTRYVGFDAAFSYQMPFGSLDRYQYFGATASLILRY